MPAQELCAAVDDKICSQGKWVLQIVNRKAMTDKYVAAVVKHTIDFSKGTYSAAYNKFSQFVSENQTLEAERIAELIIMAMTEECCLHFCGPHHDINDFRSALATLSDPGGTCASLHIVCALLPAVARNTSASALYK